MVVAAVRRGARRQAGLRQGDRGPRRREPEGARVRVPRGAPRHSRRGKKAARQPRPRRRGRGGDRLAALRRGRAATRRQRRAREDDGRLHAVRLAGSGRLRHGLPRRQGRRGARARLERREVGTRPDEGRPLRNRARLDSPAFHLVQALATLVTPTATPPSTASPRRRSPRLRRRSARCSTRPPRASTRRLRSSMLGADRWIARRFLAGSAREVLLLAHREHPGARRRLHRARRKDDASEQAPSRSSTCASSPT